MRRLSASFAFLFLLPFPAFACDLRIVGRPLAVAAYVEMAQPCLAWPPGGYGFEETLETRFLDLVNKERAAAGLAPLQMRRELTDAARLHSLDMAVNGFFGHVGPDGRGHGERIAALDRTALADFSAENVATLSRAAQTLQGRPKGLEGWRFVRYEVVGPSGDPFPGGSRARPGRDARLAAYATQPGDDPMSYYWMRFPGPAVTIAP